MRCYICDYDEVLGNSDYVDTSGFTDLGDGIVVAAGRKTIQSGAGKVRPDKEGKYICSACRGASSVIAEEFLLDMGESSWDNTLRDEDGIKQCPVYLGKKAWYLNKGNYEELRKEHRKRKKSR